MTAWKRGDSPKGLTGGCIGEKTMLSTLTKTIFWEVNEMAKSGKETVKIGYTFGKGAPFVYEVEHADAIWSLLDEKCKNVKIDYKTIEAVFRQLLYYTDWDGYLADNMDELADLYKDDAWTTYLNGKEVAR